jgi:hypothetical protein
MGHIAHLVGKPKWRRQLGRSRSRRKNNIKMDFKRKRYQDRDWIHLA